MRNKPFHLTPGFAPSRSPGPPRVNGSSRALLARRGGDILPVPGKGSLKGRQIET